MARRHLRRYLTERQKQEMKKKHTKNCKEGKHDWYPVRATYANKAYCAHCKTEEWTKNLSKKDREWVKAVAKTLRKAEAQTRALHPMRTFNKDGY